MAAGELTAGQLAQVRWAVREAESTSGRPFAVVVGDAGEDPRATARDLHAQMVDPAEGVLVLVDPRGRTFEIVTGERARRVLNDGAVALAAVGMQSSFAGGDLLDGIVRGVQQLAEHARAPRLLHS